MALALVALGWLLTTLVQSPEEALASASPPPPSRITVPIDERALDLTVTVTSRLTSPTTVHGNLNVDERTRAEDAGRIVIATSETETEARLKSIGPDGDFVVVADAPIAAATGSTVRAIFEPRERPASTLVVPVSALFTSAAGRVAVVVVDGGQEHEIPVKVGIDSDGWVAITSAEGHALNVGDQVLVSEPTG